MEAFLVQGGIPLKGRVKVSGAKNAVLPLMAAALLTSEPCILDGVPGLRDVKTMVAILEALGAEVVWAGDRIIIRSNPSSSCEAPYELVKTMRASVLVLGPMVGRFRRAKISLPGGCAIGVRPIDLHLKALEKLGVAVALEGGYVMATCSRLRGSTVYFDKVTVTGTENILMASVLAEGETVLENCAREPEIQELARVLKGMGAVIEGEGSDTIHVRGVRELGGYHHRVMPDRIEAATLLMAGAITGGEVEVEGIVPQHLEAVTQKLAEAEMSISVQKSSIEVRGDSRPKSVDITTLPYPGFPTDAQAQFMALMTLAQGTSIIIERIFENRFLHAAELQRMGARIKVEGSKAIVNGVEYLKGAPVMATDLRASASLVLAALASEGTTRISRIYHLDRGYERLDEKLVCLGAHIERVG
jgi:UDP-N-acetylglucosamine 1-carboxyvinyltransferase